MCQCGRRCLCVCGRKATGAARLTSMTVAPMPWSTRLASPSGPARPWARRCASSVSVCSRRAMRAGAHLEILAGEEKHVDGVLHDEEQQAEYDRSRQQASIGPSGPPLINGILPQQRVRLQAESGPLHYVPCKRRATTSGSPAPATHHGATPTQKPTNPTLLPGKVQ
jgi:hypothetical protein